MGRMFYAAIECPAFTTTQDIWSLAAGAEQPVAIHGFEIGNITLEQDANEEMIELHLIRRLGAYTQGAGTTETGYATDETGTTVDAATVRSDGAASSGGTAEILAKFAVNNRAGLVWVPPPEGHVIIGSADMIHLLSPNTITSQGFAGWLLYEQLYGTA